MIILVDIGNSNIVISQYDKAIGESFRYKTDTTKSIDEYYVLLKDVIKEAKGMIISSVVPELNIIFKNLALKYLHLTPMFVGPGIKTGVRISTDNPKEVGADLVASASAVINEYGENAVVIDMGTATTFTYIEDKIIKGVSITAGLITQKDALVGKTSQLSQFEFKTPKSSIGQNTIDSLNTGLLYSHSYLIKGIAEQIRREFKEDAKVIVTGGTSRFVNELLPSDYIFDDQLLLKGLLHIYHKNNK